MSKFLHFALGAVLCAQSFVQAQIPTTNLSLWLRADAGVTTTVGNVVTAWADQSPNALTMSRFGSPTLIPNTINGMPAVRFNGSNTYFTNASALLNAPTKLTAFAVCRFSNTNAGDVFYNGSYGLRRESGVNGAYSFYINSTSNSVLYPSSINSHNLYMGRYDQNAISGRFNSTTTSSFTYNAAIGINSLFYVGVGFAYLNGEIAELIIYNEALNDLQVDQVYTYLAEKYDLGMHPDAPLVSAIGTKTSLFDSNYEGTRVAASGFGSAGDVVTIQGSNFNSITGVFFNYNIPAESYNVINSTLIEATLPDGLAHVGKDFSGRIRVRNAVGGRSSTQNLEVIYSNSAPSGVIQVVPGSSFSIEGTDLRYINGVTVAGIHMPFVYDANSARIVLQVSTLLGLGSKTIRVSQSTYLGNQVFDFADPINIVSTLPSAIITSMTPYRGAIDGVVTLLGNHFSASPNDNAVSFGTNKAQVIQSSSTMIKAQLPRSTGFEHVSITNLNSSSQYRYYFPSIQTFTGGGTLTGNMFSGQTTHDASGNSYNIAVGDLDGDNKPDVVTARYTSSTITIGLNKASNSTIVSNNFQTSFSLNVGSNPYTIKIVDIDNDGRSDISVSNYSNSFVTVYKNNHTSGVMSAASFSRVDIPTVNNFFGIDWADMDGDGRLDLIGARYSDHNIYIYKNNNFPGTITSSGFASGVTFFIGTGAQPYNVVASDLNNDGKPDLVVPHYGNANVSVFENIATHGVINGSSLATPFSMSLPSVSVGVTVGDLDSDGKNDLIVSNYSNSSISVFKNKHISGNLAASHFNERHNFTAGVNPYLPSLGDLDGDGRLDIIVPNYSSNTVSLFWNKTESSTITGTSFAPKVDLNVANGPTQIATTDVDGDGKSDMAIARYGVFAFDVYKNGIYPPISISGYSPNAGLPLSIVTLDGVHMANVSQIRVGTAVGSSFVFISDSKLVVRIPAGAVSAKIELINSLGVASSSQEVFTITGATPYAVITAVSPIIAPLGGAVNILGSGFDAVPSLNNVWFGATKMPVISATTNQMVVSVAGGASSSKISYQNSYGLNDQWKLPFGYSFAGGNLTAGSFTHNATLNTGSQPYNVISHDLDGDGRPDLIATNYNTSSNHLSIYRNNSVNSTINGTSFSTPFNLSGYTWYAFQTSVGDLDGDGKPDVLIPCYNASYFTIIKNNNTPGTLTSASFGAKNDILVSPGYRSYGSAIADMDNDGLNDLIFSSYNSGGIFVYRNLGNGKLDATGFQYVNFWSTGGNPTVIQITDLDGDGKKDISVGNTATAYVSVFRNVSSIPGSINFATRVDVSTPSTPYGIAIADINGDSKPEIIASNYSSNQVSVFQNNTTIGTLSGTLFTRIDFATSISPYGIHAGDLDGDGKPEIVVSSQSELQYTIFKNNYQSGNIAANQFVRIDKANTQYPSGLELVDLDLDGKQEIVMANTNANTLFIYKNQIGGGARPTITGFSPASGEALSTFVTVTGEGFSSVSGVTLGTLQLTSYTLVNANTLVFRVPNTTGTGVIGIANSFGTVGYSTNAFTITGVAPIPLVTLVSPINVSSSQIITLSGLGFSTAAGNNVVYVGAERAGIVSQTNSQILVQNTIGTNNAQISVINTLAGLQGVAHAFINNTFAGPNTITSASFAPFVSTTTGNNSYVNEIVDLDGDGRSDMITAGYGNNSISVFRNISSVGGFTLSAPQNFTVGTNPFGIAVFDVDNDGRKDVVVGNYSSGSISIFRNISNPGTISFAPRVDIATPGVTPYGFLSAGDLDGDGFLDLTVPCYYQSSLVLFRNAGITGTITSASFTSRTDFTGLTNVYDAQIVDMDGDGKSDLVYLLTGTNQLVLRKNIGTNGQFDASILAPGVSFGTSTSPTKMSIKDLDNDGRNDIVVTNQSTSFLSIYKNNTSGNTITGSSLSSFTISSLSNPWGLVCADIDGDGRLDIVYGRYNSGIMAVNRNISTVGGLNASSFAARVEFPAQNGVFGLSEGDLDGDGKTDILASVYNTNTLNIYRNLSAGAPSITGFNPTSGQAGIATFTITGSELSAVTSLRIGSGITQSFIAKSDDQLVVRVPAAATSGNIVLQNIFGATTTSVGIYTITAPYPYPSIAGIAPIRTGAGNEVSISGSNFSTNSGGNVVYFGAARGTVTGFSSNSVTALMPSGATYNALTLLNRDSGISLTGINYQQIPTLTFAGANTINGNTFGTRIDIITPSTGTANATGDFDNDGKVDVVIGYSNQVTVYRNNSSQGTLSGSSFATSNYGISGNPFDMEVADIDNDGRLDIITGAQNTNNFSVLRNISTGPGNIAFAPAVNFATTPSSTNRGVEVVDVDLDGYIDVVLSEIVSGANTITVYRNAGMAGTITGSQFAERYPIIDLAGSTPIDVKMVDLNGDNLPDAAVSLENLSTNNIRLYRNQSQAGFISFGSTPTQFSTGLSNSRDLQAADFDGDGKMDLVVSHWWGSTSDTRFIRNTSSLSSISGSMFNYNNSPNAFYLRYLNVSDIDGDGKMDVFGAEGSTSKLRVYRNTSTVGGLGQNSFSPAVDFPMSNTEGRVQAADLTGDGRPEIIQFTASARLHIWPNQISDPATITGLSPNPAVAGVSIVTATGTGLQASSLASLAGSGAVTIVGASTNTIVFRVPASATNSVLTVTNLTGAVAVSSSVLTITAFPYPTITAILPIKAAAGESVAINGFNFSTLPGQNEVYFGNAKAAVVSASANQLWVQPGFNAVYDEIKYSNRSTELQSKYTYPFNLTFTGMSTITGATYAPIINHNNLTTSMYKVVLGDLDGDGKLDAVSSTYQNSYLSIFRNIGSAGTWTGTSFDTRIDINIPGGYFMWDMELEDIDFDGKPDIIFADANGGRVGIIKNNCSPGSMSSGSFAAPVYITGMLYPFALEVADFDLDGKMDIAVMNGNANTGLYILRNLGVSGTITGASFASPLLFGTSYAYAYDLEAADLDQDGKPDLVATNYANNGFTVFRNTGNVGQINFSAFTTNVGAQIIACKLGDIDNDGKVDMAFSNLSNSSMYVYKNISIVGTLTGSSFAPAVTFTVGSGGYGIDLGDLDGDGWVDAVVSNSTSNTISILRNNRLSGTITGSSFSPSISLNTNSRPTYPKIADMDLDGKPDILFPHYNSNLLSVYRNNLTATPTLTGFTPTSATAFQTLSLTGLDLNTVNQVRIGGVLAPNLTIVGTNALLVQVPLLATTGQVTVSNPQGSSSTAPGVFTMLPVSFPTITGVSPSIVGFGQSLVLTGQHFNTLSGQNIVELGAVRTTATAISSTEIQVSVPSGVSYESIRYLNTGSKLRADYSIPSQFTFSNSGTITGSSFAPKVDFGTGAQPYYPTIKDLDGDGKPEIIQPNFGTTTISILPNAASATITSSSFTVFNINTSYNPLHVAAEDVDNDGKPDLVVTDYYSNRIWVYKNVHASGSLNASSFASPVSFTTATNPQTSAIADIDGDGFNDIAVANYNSASISIFRNLGTLGQINSNTFDTKIDFTTSSQPIEIGLVDMDEDGRQDIVTSNNIAPAVSFLKNRSTRGSISFAAHVSPSTSYNGYGLAIGDLNNDRKPEVVALSRSSAFGMIFQNNTSNNTITGGSFAVTNLPVPIYGYRSAKIADMDGDGKNDLIVPTAITSVSIYRNIGTNTTIGTGSFASKVDLPTQSYSWGVAIADLDGDFKPDIVTSNYSSNSVSVIRNNQTSSLLPTVDAFVPPAQRRGRTMTINGFNFVGVSQVSLPGGSMPFIVMNATSIATTLPGVAGTGLVSIVGFGGTGVSSLVFTVTSTPAPSITGVYPSNPLQNQPVTISGTELEFLTGVTISGLLSTNFQYNAANQTIVTTIPGSATPGDVRVATLYGGVSPTQASSYINVIPLLIPTVSGISPSSGFPGNVVSVLGSNFVSVSGVSISGQSVGYTVAHANLILLTLPSINSGKVSVSNYSGTSSSIQNIQVLTAAGVDFGRMLYFDGVNNYVNLPSVGNALEASSQFTFEAMIKKSRAISPAGEDVFIASSNVGGWGVYMSGGSRLTFGKIGTSEISTTNALTDTLWHHVAVAVNGATVKFYIDGVLDSQQSYPQTYASANSAYHLGSRNGAQLYRGRMDEVRIWNVERSVSGINSTRCGEITGNEPGLVAYYRLNEIPGTTYVQDASANVLNGTLLNFNTATERIVSTAKCYAPSTITSYLPNPAQGGFDVLTIEGSGFESITSIRVSTLLLPNYTVIGQNRILVALPLTVTSGSLVVRNANFETTATGTFTIAGQEPIITALIPSSERRGRTITLVGSNFVNVQNVSLAGGVPTYQVVSPSMIRLTLPGTAFNGPITVTNLAGVGVSAAVFTVVSTPSPSVSGINPAFAVVGNLIGVVLTEFEFLQTPISVGGIALTNFTIAGNNLSFVVPIGMSSGNVQIRTLYGGISSTSSGNYLTILPPPVITDFGNIVSSLGKFANNGCGGAGELVTIMGQNFAPGSTDVYFNNFNSINPTVTSTLILARTPNLEGLPGQNLTGKIRIQTPGGTVQTATNLTGIFCTHTPHTTLGLSLGSSFEVTGNDLSLITAATIGGVSSSSITYNASNQKLTIGVPANAAQGLVSVTLGQGTFTKTFPFSFYIFPKPTITGLQPNPASIGATLSILGLELTSLTAVNFNGASASIIQGLNSNVATVTVPAGVSSGNIFVQGVGGTSNSFGPLNIAPSLQLIQPGAQGIGNLVTLSGLALNEVSQVWFNGVSGSIQSKSYHLILVNVPHGATSGNVQVVSPSFTSPGIGFVVLGPPSISNIQPASAKFGDTITLSGTNFSLAGNNLVKFEGANSVPATLVGLNTLLVQVPADARLGFIEVQNNGGSATSAIAFVPKPTLDPIFVPATAGGGAHVRLFGKNLSNPSLLRFKGIIASFNPISATEVEVTIPAAAGTGNVSVDITTDGGLSNTVNFPILAIPSIAGISPAAGQASELIYISGGNFYTTLSGVLINGTSALHTVLSSNMMVAAVPNSALVAIGNIKVQNAANYYLSEPSNFVSSNTSFQVRPTLTTVTSIYCTGFPSCTHPIISTAKWGDQIRIIGNNFFNGMQATLNGNALSVQVSSSSVAIATIPNGASSGQLVLQTSGGTSNSAHFTIIPPPTIQSISPLSGTAGTRISIIGSNFENASAVQIGSDNAPFVVVDGGWIVATVPSAAGVGKIVVHTPGGQRSSLLDFEATPFISSLDYYSSPVGSRIRILGTNLNGPTQINFGGISATHKVESPEMVTVTVPSGAISGLVTLQNPGGNAISPGAFTVSSITSLNAVSGVQGTPITVSGIGFEHVTGYSFEGTSIFTPISNSPVVVTLPGTALYGQVRLHFQNGGIAQSSEQVQPIPVITAILPGAHGPTQKVQIQGSNVRSITHVLFGGIPTTLIGTDGVTTRNEVEVPTLAKTGPVSITITGGATAVSSFNFTIISISGINPTTGLGGTVVTVSGSDLDYPSSVTIDNVPVTIDPTSNYSRIIFTVPGTVSGGNIVVYKDGGFNDLFSFNLPNASITGVSPLVCNIGQVITIQGSNFQNSKGVYINSTSYPLPYQVISSNAMLATVTAVAINGPIVVKGQNNQFAQSAATVIVPPVLSSLPAPGILPASQQVIINGYNLVGSNISVSGLAATVTSGPSIDQVTIRMPASITSGSIIASNAAGQSSIGFSLLSLTQVSTTAGIASAIITLNGTSLANVVGVYFDEVSASFTPLSSTALVAAVPSTAGIGNIRIEAGAYSVSSSTFYPIPQISGFTVTGGISSTIAKVGSRVLLQGTNLKDINFIRLNSGNNKYDPNSFLNACYTPKSPIQISNICVDNTASSGKIVASNGVHTVSIDGFGFVGQPGAVAAIAATPGSQVTIIGSNLNTVTSVSFGSQPATSFIQLSSTTLVAQVPATATISGTLSIETLGGNTSSSYTAPPIVTGFSAPALGESMALIVFGHNLDSYTQLSFGSLTTTGSSSANAIHTTVPLGALTNTIWVTNPAGTVESPQPFVVLPKPIITDFSPKAGPAGTQILLTGLHLSSITSIRMGGGASSVAGYSILSPTEIAITVAEEVLTGSIVLQNAQLYPSAIASTAQFVGTPGISSLVNISKNNAPYIGATGDQIRISGLNFTNPSRVFFNGTESPTVNYVNSSTLDASVPATASSGIVTISSSGGNFFSPQSFEVVRIVALAPSITISCSGAQFGVSYTVSGLFPADNVFSIDIMNGAAVVASEVGTRISRTSGVIQGTLPANLEGNYQVRIRATSASSGFSLSSANSASFAVTNINEWLGGSSTDPVQWSLTENWGCGMLPSASSTAWVPNAPLSGYYPVINGSATVGNLVALGKVTLTTSGVMLVYGNMSIAGSNSFESDPTGFVIFNGVSKLHSANGPLRAGNISVTTGKHITLHAPLQLSGSISNNSSNLQGTDSQGMFTNGHAVSLLGSVFQAIGNPLVTTTFDDLYLENTPTSAGVALAGPVFIKCKFTNNGIFYANGYLTKFIGGPCYPIVSGNGTTVFNDIEFDVTVPGVTTQPGEFFRGNFVQLGVGPVVLAPVGIQVQNQIQVLGNFTRKQGSLGVYMTSTSGVRFAGSASGQIIDAGGAVLSYHDFEVSNPLGVQLTTTPGVLAVSGTFTNNGVFSDSHNTLSFTGANTSLQGSGSTLLHHVEVATGSTISLLQPLEIKGNVRVRGKVLPSGNTVTFSSGSQQNLESTGTLTLSGLHISAATVLSVTSHLVLHNNIANEGTLIAPKVSTKSTAPQSLDGAGVLQLGELENHNSSLLGINTNIELTGNLTNHGILDTKVGGVMSFTGSSQILSGTQEPQLSGIYISTTSTLSMARSVRIRGNVQSQGTLVSNNQTLVFNGQGGQTVESTQPLQLGSVSISQTTQLDVNTSAILTGNIFNEGTTRLQGNATFSGAGAQSIGGNGTLYVQSIFNTNSLAGLNVSSDLHLAANIDNKGSFQHTGTLYLEGFNQSITGTVPVLLNNVDLAPGAQLVTTSKVRVRGHIQSRSVQGGFGTQSAPLSMEGSSLQTISGTQALSVPAISVSNFSGVMVTTSLTAHRLTLSGGNVHSTLPLTIEDQAPEALVRTNNSYIAGPLRRGVLTVAGKLDFPVGTASSYRGATLDFASSGSGKGYVSVSHTDAAPVLPTGRQQALDTALQRLGLETLLPMSWTIEAEGISTGTYHVQFESKLPLGSYANASGIQVVKRRGPSYPWTLPGTGGQSALGGTTNHLLVSRQGLEGFSEFALAGTCENLSKNKAKPIVTWTGSGFESTLAGSKYQWNINGITSPTDTSASLVPLRTGRYKVRVYQEGCYSPYSLEVSYVSTIAGPASLSNTGIPTTLELYPNPAQDYITLTIQSGTAPSAWVQAYDLMGNLVWEQHIGLWQGKSQKHISISHLASGVYFVHCRVGDSLRISKLVIERK